MKFDRTNGYVEFDIENRKVTDAAYRGPMGKIYFIENGNITEPYVHKELSAYEAEAIDLSYTFSVDVNVIFNFDDGVTIIENKDGEDIVHIYDDTEDLYIINAKDFESIYIGPSVAIHNIIESVIHNNFLDYSVSIEKETKKVEVESNGLVHSLNDRYVAFCDEDGHIKNFEEN